MQHCEFQRRDDILVVSPPPNLLNLGAIQEMEEEWRDQLSDAQTNKLVFDMRRVVSCGSDAISSMVRTTHNLRERGGDVRICCLNERVGEVFMLSRLLGTLLPAHATLDEAIEAM